MTMALIRDHADIETGLAALVRLDPRLERIIDGAGAVPLRLREGGFSGLAHIIVSQMISRASADAIWARMVAALGEPSADAWRAAPVQTVAGFGLSRNKIATLDGVASAMIEGGLNTDALAALPVAEATRILTAIGGIGPWTAEVYLMFCCGHADIFPAGDVALRAAVGDAFGLDTRPDVKELSVMARQWQPWRSVAARLFWSWYAARLHKSAMPVP